MTKHRCSAVLALAVTAAALLVAPSAALAVKTPGLASSSQYKAFVEYVTKLDGLTSQATSTAQKNTYEAKLTAKKTAAAHKGNALFKRASEEAAAEANAAAKEQVERVRAKEGKELEALAAEAEGKIKKLETGFHAKFDRIATGHHNREKALKAQIAELRAKKAAAGSVKEKNQIQERIETLSGEVTANRGDEKTKRQALKAAINKQEKELHAAAEAKETELGEAAEETVKKIDQHWNKGYLEKKAALNTTRENRLGYLEKKLEQGRADIAAMPTS
jgi:chromosome segregation ATPase